MQLRHVRIKGTGKYLPERTVSDAELDDILGTPPGWVNRITGVGTRRYAGPEETASFMGARAAEAALADAGLRFEDIDCLVCTSGTKEQPLPSTAVFIQQAMGQADSGVPAFDVDATCLSFLVGLDLMSYMVDAGRYKNVLLVATEIASVGLNWQDKESSALFGDGAAAVVIGPSGEGIPHGSFTPHSKPTAAERGIRRLPGAGPDCIPRSIQQRMRYLTCSIWMGRPFSVKPPSCCRISLLRC